MANVTISSLPQVSSANVSDVFPLVASGITSKITGGDLVANLVANNINLASYSRNFSAGNITVTGNISAGNITVAANITAGNIGSFTRTDNANSSSNLTAVSTTFRGNVLLANAIPVPLGSHANGAVIWPDLGSPSNPWNVIYATQSLSVGGPTGVGISSDTGVATFTDPSTAGAAGISAGDITGDELTANAITVSGLLRAGNIITGNITSNANITTTGNVSANYFLGNGAFLTGIAGAYGNSNVANYLLALPGDIIPNANATYSLGNSTNQWSNLWVSNTTIYLGGVPISVSASNVLVVGGNPVLSSNSNTAISAAANITTTANVSANYFLGNGAFLTGIAGTYGNSDVANYLASNSNVIITVTGNVTGGNLTSRSTSGTANAVIRTLGTAVEIQSNLYVNTAANANSVIRTSGQAVVVESNLVATGNVTGTYVLGNGAFLTGISGGISSSISNGNTTLSIPTANGSITGSLGTGGTDAQALLIESHLGANGGRVTLGSTAGGSNQGRNSIAIGACAASFTQSANSVAVGAFAGLNAQGTSAVAIGVSAGSSTQGLNAVAVGIAAGATTQGAFSVAVGPGAGATDQGNSAVAVGVEAGISTQGSNAVAVGSGAGYRSQGANSIAIGANSAQFFQGNGAIAIGESTGGIVSIPTTQAADAVAIGRRAGANGQGAGSIYIGALAGENSNRANTIVLNATGAALNPDLGNATYISSVREDTSNVSNALYFNTTTRELTFGPAGSGGSYGNSNVANYLPTYTGNLSPGNLTVANDAVITGNLRVLGTTTTINANTLSIGDKDIVIANGAATASDANGAGILVGSTGQYASMIWRSAGNLWDFSGNIAGDVAYFDNLEVVANITNLGNTNVTGNVTAAYLLGNGAFLTGLAATYSNANVFDYLGSNSNVVITTTGNVTSGNLTARSTSGTANAVVRTLGTAVEIQSNLYVNTAANANSVIRTSGTAVVVESNLVANASNITASYFLGNGAFLTGISAGSSYSNANVANYLPTYTGNLDSLTGNVITTGNITANYVLGNGYFLTGIDYDGYSNANVANYLPTYTGNLVALTGNITTTANISGDYLLGNIRFATGGYGNADVLDYLGSNSNIVLTIGTGNITTQGNITAANITLTSNNNAVISTSGTAVEVQSNLAVSGNIAGTAYLRIAPVTVTNLVAASTAGVGARAFVTDGDSNTFGAVIGGSGANAVPVYSDGTDWRVG